jgi:hypothetical protein
MPIEARMRLAMPKVGARIDERGTLACEGERMLFRREVGGRWQIDGSTEDRLSLGRSGRLVGTLVDASTVAIEHFTPEI